MTRQVAGGPPQLNGGQHSSVRAGCPKAAAWIGRWRQRLLPLMTAITVLMMGAGCGAQQKAKGPAAPALTATTLDGKKLRLADYRGQVVLLDFMASWCRPCEVAVPHYVQMDAKWRAKGLRVLLISQDEDREDIVEFVGRLKVKLPVAMDPGERWYKAFSVKALPTVVLIDGRGRVRAVIDGSDGPSAGPGGFTARVEARTRALLDER